MSATRAARVVATGLFCYLLGSYLIATAPEPNSSRLTSFRSIRFESPANNVGPWPAILGCTTRRSEFPQSLGRISPERQASPNFTQPFCLLIHHRFNPHPTESDCRRQAPNPASDDDDLHLNVVRLRAVIG